MTGEMCYADIGPGGEHEAWAADIRAAAIAIGRKTRWKLKFIKLQPFDVYQGPYAVTNLGTLWSHYDEERQGERLYVLCDGRWHDLVAGPGTVNEIVWQLRTNDKRK